MGYGNHDLERDITLVRLLFHFIILLCQTSYARLLVDFIFKVIFLKLLAINVCIEDFSMFQVFLMDNTFHISPDTKQGLLWKEPG